MRIKNIKLASFKGIDAEVSIPLAPITLLFGANSSGKSTILQALMYLYEVVRKNNLDPVTSTKQENGCAFNGFKSLVHGKDLKRVIVIEVEIDVSSVVFDSYLSASDEFMIAERLPDIMLNEASVQTASLRFEIAHDENEGVYIKRYTSIIDGEPFSSISKKPSSPKVKFFPLFKDRDDLDEIYGDADLKDSLLDALNGGGDPVFLDGMVSALPSPDKKLQIADLEWHPNADDSQDSIAHKLYTEVILSQLTVGPIKILADILAGLVHIGPVRKVPCRGYAPSKIPVDWYGGMASWDRFAFAPYYLREKVNESFADKGFQSRYEFFTDGRYKNVLVKDLDLETVHEPSELGIGVSQVFPFVVAVADSEMRFVSVEQPELHIHPKWQLILGDLLTLAIRENPGRLFLIETHSEHLMLRLLGRVREGMERGREAKMAVSSEDISVVCVYRHEGKPYYQRQRITPDGDFELDWPEGFFEERYREI